MEDVLCIRVINGPNLNMLGRRESGIYGNLTLEQINQSLEKKAENLGIRLDFFQSNHEGAIVDYLQEIALEKNVAQKTDGIILNPGGLTHTSVVLRDALSILSCPVVEVHLSNIYRREDFRHKSLVANVVFGQITGFGAAGYHMALDALYDCLTKERR